MEKEQMVNHLNPWRYMEIIEVSDAQTSWPLEKNFWQARPLDRMSYGPENGMKMMT
jgi:hypothetical protein